MVINSPLSNLAHSSSPSKSSMHHESSPPKSSMYPNDLPIRTACNFCRSKKIKCDKTAVEDGGCARCKREDIMCCYDVRDPIGRPKKRRMTGDSSLAIIHQPSQHARTNSNDLSNHNLSSNPERSYTEAGMYISQANGSNSSKTNKTFPIKPSYPTAIPITSQWPNLPALNAIQQRYNSIYTVEKSQNAQIRNSHTVQSTSQSMSPSNQSIQSAATSSHGMTPSSSTTTFEPVRPSGFDDAPNLSDLGLAAFLESLDTLEINTEDGLTSAMLEALAANSIKEDFAHAQIHQQSFLPSLSSSVNSVQNTANLQGSTSYAVPADLSWADSSWLDQISAQSASSLDKMMSKGTESFIGENQEISSSSSSSKRKKDEKGQRIRITSDDDDVGKSKSCCCGKEDGKLSQAMTQSNVQENILPFEDPSTRVHCVPDPTGKGCTCLCDVSVALINVRATLRQTREDQSDHLSSKSDNKRAASTLQLTLSASQAVAAQCACSASCPTCRTDPSTSLSASLLVSTALQIYIRAVRTLRQGFGAGDSRSSLNESIGGMENGSHFHATGSEWDVSIGQYKPKAINARRIALFAMKLELRDLRDAIAKVSRAASRSGMAMANEKETAKLKSCCSNNSEPNQNEFAQIGQSSSLEAGINPVDQVVIRKLHQQLGDLLRTVEGIEEQQDAERNALSVGNDLMYP